MMQQYQGYVANLERQARRCYERGDHRQGDEIMQRLSQVQKDYANQNGFGRIAPLGREYGQEDAYNEVPRYGDVMRFPKSEVDAWSDNYGMPGPSPSRPTPKAPKVPKPVKEVSPEEQKAKAEALMLSFGIKKELTLYERALHRLEYGGAEEWQAARTIELRTYYEEQQKLGLEPKAIPPAPKKICGICFDPRCPWSD